MRTGQKNMRNDDNGHVMPQKNLFKKYTKRIRKFFRIKCPCCHDIYHEDKTIRKCYHHNKQYLRLVN
jgi:hypothetical protein